jgi:hypothetical protein
MCYTDHAQIRAGYLVSANVESFAPPAILTRVLGHYQEMELAPDQITRLLDISREYNERYTEVSVEFANVTAQLDLTEVRPSLDRKRKLLDRHTELFREHESLLLEADERVRTVLTGKQIRTAVQIYDRQKQAFLSSVEPGLRRAFGPGTAFQRRREG